MTETLTTRAGLPDALRILVEQYPRDLWETHSNFDGMTRFWLERHLEFRRALEMMQSDTEAALDKTEDEHLLTRRLLHVGKFFVDALHGHHHIEDHHYFPIFIQTEPRLSRGFEILDTDHHVLHHHLDGLETRLAGLAQNMQSNDQNRVMADMRTTLDDFSKFMDRHLTDEEDLIVPIVLEHGPIHP